GFRVFQMPCGPRKSGMPLPVEMPAPVKTRMRRAAPRKSTSVLCMRPILAPIAVRRRGLRNEREDEVRARGGIALLEPEAAASALDDGARDGEAEAEAVAALAAGEGGEDALAVAVVDSRSLVGDVDADQRVPALAEDGDLPLGRRGADGVRHHVADGRGELVGVAAHADRGQVADAQGGAVA